VLRAALTASHHGKAGRAGGWTRRTSTGNPAH
jgi:hypothetical protein